MGESIKILNPDKQVLMLNKKADCPMAHMLSVEKIAEMRKKYDSLMVVTYINSSAEIKACSDVCVTSSNAIKIVKKLKENIIFFGPDKNLGAYIAQRVGKEKRFILNDGYCPVHNKISSSRLKKMKSLHKNAKVLVHPECRQEVLDLADYIGSTKGILESVEHFKAKDFIIVTEEGISAKLRERYKDKNFYFLENFVCPDMKMMKAKTIADVIEHGYNEVFVDEDIARKALIPLNLMLKLGVD